MALNTNMTLHTNMFNFEMPKEVTIYPFSSSPALDKSSCVAHSILNNSATPQHKLGEVIVLIHNYTRQYSTQMDSQAEIATVIDSEEADLNLSDPSNSDLIEIDSRNYTNSEEITRDDENSQSLDPNNTYSQNYTAFDEDTMTEDGDDPLFHLHNTPSQNYTASDEDTMSEGEESKTNFSSSRKNKTLKSRTTEGKKPKKWTQEENLKLMEQVQNIGKEKLTYNNKQKVSDQSIYTNLWKNIAAGFPGRNSLMVRKHYKYLTQINKVEIRTGRWSNAEKHQLEKLILQNGRKTETFTNDEWEEIAKQMKTRTIDQIKNKWRRVLNPKIKKSAWSQEENEIINKNFKKHGGQWTSIAEKLPGRTGIQIKQHYEDVLDSNVRKDLWTEKEDELLKTGFEKFGKKWSKIAEFVNQEMGLKTRRTNRQCFNHGKMLGLI